jgi:FixJ family two-component response regulator/HAMP domain-containing protein
MEPDRSKRFPWKSWSDFASWAQDFSLKQKVLGGFLGVVVLVGILTSLIGTNLARDAIIARAQDELLSRLATANFVLKNAQENLELKIRLWSGSERLAESLVKGELDTIRGRLAVLAVEKDLDFLSIADAKGQVLIRAFVPESPRDDVGSDFVIAQALGGKSGAGIRVLSVDRLKAENPALPRRLPEGLSAGMVIEAAHSLMDGDRVVGTLYAGIMLNNNRVIVDRIRQQLFRGEGDGKTDLGKVTLYQETTAISTTLKGADGKLLIGFSAPEAIRSGVLGQGRQIVDWETLAGARYLAAAEPVTDAAGRVVGALQVALLEKPIISVIDSLVVTFILVALFGVLLMGAISYFLVNWINRPLEQMLHAAKRAAEGDLSHEVPVIAHDEVGELAATFNLMIHNLAESQKKLEEWGKQLASKVAQQTGELNQVREQVARVKKLASLEKMADGMGHILSHISDPLDRAPVDDSAGGHTNRVLVLDPDEKVLDMCQRILESEGFDVKLTGSAEAALKELEEELYDVVVVDVETPGTTGEELFKEIRNRQPEVSVILTAPFKATEEAVEVVKLGAFDYIPKPFGPHQILLMVYTALQTRQMIRDTRRQLAEQRAEAIFQRLPVAIALADAEHRVVYHNPAFISLCLQDDQETQVRGKSFHELFGVDPLDRSRRQEEGSESRWLHLEKVGRTAKLYNFKLPEEDLRVLMLLDVTEAVRKDQQADVLRTETLTRAQQVIHQQMRVAQEIAGLLGETTAETKAALFELMKLAREGASR